MQQPQLRARSLTVSRDTPSDAAFADSTPLVARLVALHRTFGVRAVLGELNARTRHRFTGLYRVDPPLLRVVDLFDRENPALCLGGDLDMLADTYCGVVAEAGTPFATDDGHADPRIAGRRASVGPVRSYVGVAVRGPDGAVVGTLCHHDVRPRLVPLGELVVLEQAAELLGFSLARRVPPGSRAR